MKLFTLVVLVLSMFLKKSKDLLDIKTEKQNIRIQANNSIICGYFCIGFIDFIFEGKSFIKFSSLFSPYDFKKKKNLDYFK